MNLLLRICIIAIFPFFLQKETNTITVKPEEVIKTYCNPRFDFCVEYPSNVLSNVILSDNADGVILTTEPADVNVVVSGGWSVSVRNSWDLYNDFIERKLEDYSEIRIRYSIVRNSYYEVVYFLDEMYYYQKLINKGNKHVVMQIEVPSDKYSMIKKLRKQIDLEW